MTKRSRVCIVLKTDKAPLSVYAVTALHAYTTTCHRTREHDPRLEELSIMVYQLHTIMETIQKWIPILGQYVYRWET